MKSKIILKSLIIISCLLLSLNMQAQGVPTTIHVWTAGTLPTLIEANRKYNTTALTLTGNLNGTDIRYIREMAGRTYDNRETNGFLRVLDLSGANIVSGGDYYCMRGSSNLYYTSNDAIGDYAFYGTPLSNVTLPNSVTSIGNNAFEGCTGLIRVTIPNSVTTIGERAFHGARLTIVTIPNSVTSIGNNAFSGTGLTNITIPDGVISIGERAFANCTSIVHLTISNSVISIGGNAFEGCTGLREIHNNSPIPQIINNSCFTNVDKSSCIIYVPDGSYTAYRVATGWGEFQNIIDGNDNTNELAVIIDVETAGTLPILIEASKKNQIKNLTLTGNLNATDIRYIREMAGRTYDDKETNGQLTVLDLSGTNLTSPEELTFHNCANLTSLIIPNNITSIRSNAFKECTGLAGITIPNSVTIIKNGAFEGCTGLTNITIPNNVTSIGEGVFSGCTGLTNIIIGDNVTSIGDKAFADCTGLTGITIPNSVAHISGAFEGCTELKEIYMNNPVPPTTSITCFANVDKNTCKVYVPNGSYSRYWIAPNWGDFANILDGNETTNTTQDVAVTLHVETAGELSSLIAMSKRNLIEKLTLTGNLNGSDIGNIRNLAGYKSDGKLSILDLSYANIVSGGSGYFSPPNVVSTGGDTRYYTSNNIIGDFFFYECTSLTSVTMPNNVASIKQNAFGGCTSLTYITIPSSVTSIELSTFWGCTNLTSITIPNNITTIGGNAFGGCTSLTSITIPDGVTSIGSNAFSGCSSLTSITIPNSVTSIKDYTFKGCIGLTSITIPNSVTSIGEGVFSGCTGLTNITIGDNVSTIGEGAFGNCTGLTNITIPNSVTRIGKDAFWYCINLKEIHNENPIPQTICNIIYYPNGEIRYYENFIGASGCTVYVPKSSYNAYLDKHWGRFFTIIEEGATVNDNATIHVEAAGTLPTLIAESNKYLITNLTLTGNLNETDIQYIRDMAGYNNNGQLSVLDLSGTSITSIGENAFNGCTKLTSITIPIGVTSIGDYAFYNCTGLNEIHNNNPIPQVISSNSFLNVDKENCKLFVPDGSYSAYKSATNWSDFFNIIDGNDNTGGDNGDDDNGTDDTNDETSNNFTSNKSITISNTSNGIYIKTEKSITVSIFNLSGQNVYEANIQGDTNITLNKGIYVVRVGNESQKIVVR